MHRTPALVALIAALVPLARIEGVSGHQPARTLHVWIPMRDGIRLSANVFLPAEPGRYPAILVRTPYGKAAAITPHYQAFVDRQYPGDALGVACSR